MFQMEGLASIHFTSDEENETPRSFGFDTYDNITPRDFVNEIVKPIIKVSASITYEEKVITPRDVDIISTSINPDIDHHLDFIYLVYDHYAGQFIYSEKTNENVMWIPKNRKSFYICPLASDISNPNTIKIPPISGYGEIYNVDCQKYDDDKWDWDPLAQAIIKLYKEGWRIN